MHEFCFSDVSLPDRQAVLELPLLDFCIGHRLILLRQRNPLLWQTEADFNLLPFARQNFWLVEAVYVCAQSFAGRQRLEKEPTRWALWQNRRLVRKWHRHIRRAEGGVRTGVPGLAYWALEAAKFRNYLAGARIITEFEERREGFPFMPVTGMPEADGRSLGGPTDAALLQFLVRELRLDLAAALEYPLGLAQAHYLSHLERTGNLRIMNADEMEFKEQNGLRDLEAAKAAGFETVKEHVESVVAKARARESSSSSSSSSNLGTSNIQHPTSKAWEANTHK